MSFDGTLSVSEGIATIEVKGELDASTAPRFHDLVDQAAEQGAVRLEIDARHLGFLASAGLRSLVFARQKMGDEVRIAVIGATEPVSRTIRLAGFDHSIELIDA
ncbi:MULTISPECIES: STAS domain-containing protein [Streptomyces]|jgi:anti-anti-sigma factor|uniref:Anti-sigma factor antagonist n=1 Tax=Streptomyces diastatochromogenes TaxID=42236 RepID=A0A233SCE5_STRDA|nr:STAS domain-containing protein [Streptomyces diastatochromogenes]MCZ0988351.1 STAS domain-containing protein [Streptomyces diastatochromogenes]OXY93324.1 anti-anti-sigma factor [Streptomyces diastatochromogenes]